MRNGAFCLFHFFFLCPSPKLTLFSIQTGKILLCRPVGEESLQKDSFRWQIPDKRRLLVS
jgi:hypothetical protein